MSTDFRIVISADQRPAGEHERRYNAPVVNEVAALLVNEEHGKRDIVLKLRDDRLTRINETHRSYDALQYPLMLWKGQDGYQINIPEPENPRKSVTSRAFYAYHLMVREGTFNILLQYRELFHQYLVDMYAKIEAERLLYLRLHQRQLRVESYAHLRDAIENDGAADIGRMFILPSSFTGGPSYMHERIQDLMAYVRKYGSPDLFITFTCNPAWDEIKTNLVGNHKTNHRNDLTARVFHQKQRKLMDLITKEKLFGPVRCYTYTIEWQKRGLPHAHILVWLKEKVHANQIDSLISAELPNPEEDPVLYNIVKSQMVHGPCGALNPRSPCMKDGKCCKKYPKAFIEETQTGNDGYPTYRRRKPENGGGEAILRRSGNQVLEVDNRWVVPYSPFLCKVFNSHINVEFCNSVKLIKYV